MLHTHDVYVYLLLFYLYVHLTLSNVEYGNTFRIVIENIDSVLTVRMRVCEKMSKKTNKNKLCPFASDRLIILLFSE